MPPRQVSDEERRPLLTTEGERNSYRDEEEPEEIAFEEGDEDDPKQWSRRKKLLNVFIIAFMAIVSPLASSMFTPGISQIAKDLNASETEIIATTTGFVIFMGLGPLILAPFSETFGRRRVYIASFTIFTLLQIPTALSPNAATLITVRTISGFFGSVGIANGGGTINDMYEAHERASIFGWYLLGPLLGPTLGMSRNTCAERARLTCNRPAFWWHYCQSTELEMGLLGSVDRLRLQHYNRLLLFARVVRSSSPRLEKTPASKRQPRQEIPFRWPG